MCFFISVKAKIEDTIETPAEKEVKEKIETPKQLLSQLEKQLVEHYIEDIKKLGKRPDPGDLEWVKYEKDRLNKR